MAKYDDIQNLYKVTALAGDAISAGKSSPGVDCKAYEQAMVILKTGTLALNNVTTLTLQHSDDNGGADAYANITGASIVLADSDDDAIFYGKLRLNVAAIKRWVRIHVVSATAAGEYGAVLLVGNKSGEYPVDVKTLSFNVLNVA